MRSRALALLLLGACGGEQPTPPTAPAEVAIPPAAAPSQPRYDAEPMTSSEPAEPTSGPWVAGRAVVARGRVSDTPWQHLVGHVDGKQAVYFDLEDGGQTVIYVATAIECTGLVQVEGAVMEVRGPSKRPGGPETKVDDSYAELHIDVRSHRCL